MTKAWFRMKWVDYCKSFMLSIETSHSESDFMITKNQADKIIKALQQEQEELVLEI